MLYSLDFISSSLKAVLGFGLELIGLALARYFPDVDWLALSCIIIGSVLILLALAEYLFKHLRWSISSNWKFNSIIPFKVLVPLDRASSLFYDKITEINPNHIINILGKNDLNNKDLRLNHLAAYLAKGAQIYGRRSLSKKIVPLNFDQTPDFEEGGKSFADYTDIKIERHHFREKMKEANQY